MRVNCLVYPCQQEALLWLSLMASLIECRKGLLDSYDQRSQIAQREFREIAVRMDHAESLPLNDLPGWFFERRQPCRVAHAIKASRHALTSLACG